jgi:hypothetical protein
LVEKPERRPLARPTRRWNTVLKWIYEKWDLEGMNWIDLPEVRNRWRALVNAVMNLRVP